MHQHQTFDITIVGQGVKGLTDPHFQNIGSSGIFRGRVATFPAAPAVFSASRPSPDRSGHEAKKSPEPP